MSIEFKDFDFGYEYEITEYVDKIDAIVINIETNYKQRTYRVWYKY